MKESFTFQFSKLGLNLIFSDLYVEPNWIAMSCKLTGQESIDRHFLNTGIYIDLVNGHSRLKSIFYGIYKVYGLICLKGIGMFRSFALEIPSCKISEVSCENVLIGRDCYEHQTMLLLEN